MKVVRMDSTYHEEILSFFGEEADKFYFIISDIIRNNFSEQSFKLYGEFDNNKLQSILLNNFNNLTYFSRTDRSFEVYKDVLKKLNFNKISGPNKLVEKVIPYVNIQGDGLSYLGYVNKIILDKRYTELPIRFINTDEEIGMQYDLLKSSKEYIGMLPDNKETYIAEQKNKININSRTAYLMIDNQMVSSCSTIAEHDKSAIIVGVVTNPKFRNKGFGSEVLIGIFEVLLKEGKKPYLFYNNPSARSVYMKIGMEEVCEWRVAFLK